MQETTDGNGALAPLTRAERMLALAQEPGDFMQIMDLAEAARVLAERARLGTSAINRATSIKLHAMAGLARAVDEGQANGTIAVQGRHATAGSMSLSGIGVDSKTVRESRLVALADAEYGIDTLTSAKQASDQELTRTEVVALGRRIESGITEGQGDDWYTPSWLFDALGLRFDLDVCAPADPAMQSCPAAAHLTEEDDGMASPWQGLVWCNPPYSLAAPWMARMIAHGNGVMLTHIPANASWAVDAWRHADVMVPLQAVEFARPNGKTYRPGVALMLLGFGPTASHAVAGCAKVTPKAGAAWSRLT